MAVVSMHSNIVFKGQVVLHSKLVHYQRRIDCSVKPHTIWCCSETSTTERQVKALDSYFCKLENTEQRRTSFMPSRNLECFDKNIEPFAISDQFKAKKKLSTVDNYRGTLNAALNSGNRSDETTRENPIIDPYAVSRDSEESEKNTMNSYIQIEIKTDVCGPDTPQVLQQDQPYDETSDLYLMSFLASINIGVFLFEVASPVRISDLELLSLPSLYGAKINELILVGEWWRLVTPMFLHSGFLHVALGCWVLLTFGPQVCKGYGPLTFLLIYLLGGFSGNLTSFIHTPETTIGGTGPVFAIIGAWLIYQLQNKEAIAKETSRSLFQKAVIATALSFILSYFGPIDDWAHLGATCVGIAYGYLTCPNLQLDNALSKTGQEDGTAPIRRYADPIRSSIMFIIFVAILSSLLFFLEPQVIPLETDVYL